MFRKVRRAPVARRFRLEVVELDARCLLSGVAAANPAHELFVRFQAGATSRATQAALRSVGGTIVESFPDGPVLVALGTGLGVAAAITRLQANPLVLYAEPDATLHAAAVVPNDPQANLQWGLSNPNMTDINAPAAWGITTGNPATIVAVLDSGIDLRNVDFAGRIWTNPNPRADRGFRNDLHGWNFVSNTNNVQDNNGHGTHITGILAATGNNGTGVAGVNWNARIMPVKVLDSAGNGTTDAAVKGIYFAVNHGARVINASWGGGEYSRAMIDALNYANAHGVVFVTAAGNDGTNNDTKFTYPASYRLPNEVVVAATDISGNLAGFSNYGAGTVDVAAPGVSVLSTIPGGFAAYSGTSMATPFVAGVVALLVGVHPDWNAEQLIQRVLSTARPLSGLSGRVATGGIVDAYNALVDITTASLPTGAAPAQPAALSAADVFASILATDDFWSSSGSNTNGFVAGLFQVVLDRAPDPGGFAYFTGLLNHGVARFTVAQDLVASPEAHQLLVAHWYQTAFHSPLPLAVLATDPGVVSWSTIVGAYGAGAALAGLVSTDAFWNDSGGTVAGFINGAFQVVLGRAPDPAGFTYFSNLLLSGRSRFAVVQALQATTEAKTALVAQWYQQYFGAATPIPLLETNPGVTYWARFLSGA